MHVQPGSRGVGVPKTGPGAPDIAMLEGTIAQIKFDLEQATKQPKNKPKNDLEPQKPPPQPSMEVLLSITQQIEQLRSTNRAKAEELLNNVRFIQNYLIEVNLPELITDMANVADPIEFKKVADLYKPESVVKVGLAKLEPQFAMVPISPDGHCCFRSLGDSLARKLVTPDGPANAKFLKHCTENLDAFVEKEKHTRPPVNTSELEARAAALKGHLQSVANGRIALRQLVDSDEFVAIMRNLIYYYLKDVADKDVKAAIAGMNRPGESRLSIDERIEAHINRIKNTVEWGDAPEIRAFTEIFNVKVGVLHADDIGRGRPILAEDKVYGPKTATDELLLLYRPGHYDAAFRK